MKRLPLLAGLLLAATMAFGQELEIRYYAQNDSIVYLLDGTPTKKPRTRAGQMVTLRIINYNNYLYQATVTAKDEKVASAPTVSNLNGLAPGGGEGGGSPLGMLMGLFNAPVPLSFNPDNFNAADRGSGFGNASAAIQNITREFKNTTAYIKVLEEDLQQNGQDIQHSLESQRISGIAVDEIKKLKLNPNIPPQKIKTLSKEYLGTILGTEQADALSLGEVLKKADAAQQLPQSLDHYSKYIDTLTMEMDKVGAMQSALEELQAEPAFVESIASYHAAGSQRLAQYRQTAETAQEQLPKVQDLSVPTLLALRYQLEELEANDFSYTYRTIAEGDALSLQLALQPVDSADALGARSRQLPSLQVPVYGGFKVNASVGVSFGGFFEQPQAYFIKDSTIVAEDKDKFLPIITSFVHFYPQSAGNVSLGGAFGVGLPLGGENGAQSISFFLGPSLIMGKGERITLNAGLMGGKAKRLGQGYAVGDRYVYEPGPSIGSEGDVVPTRTGYELGYFLGVSFNLF